MLQSVAFRGLVLATVLVIPLRAFAQGTIADYQRATSLRDRYQNLARGVTDQVRWVYNTHKVVYRKTVRGGTEFVVVDDDTGAQAPAFDHARLAAGLGRDAVHSQLAAALSVVVHLRRTAEGRRVEELGVVRRSGDLVVVESGWRADGGPCPAGARLRALLAADGT